MYKFLPWVNYGITPFKFINTYDPYQSLFGGPFLVYLVMLQEVLLKKWNKS